MKTPRRLFRDAGSLKLLNSYVIDPILGIGTDHRFMARVLVVDPFDASLCVCKPHEACHASAANDLAGAIDGMAVHDIITGLQIALTGESDKSPANRAKGGQKVLLVAVAGTANHDHPTHATSRLSVVCPNWQIGNNNKNRRFCQELGYKKRRPQGRLYCILRLIQFTTLIVPTMPSLKLSRYSKEPAWLKAL